MSDFIDDGYSERFYIAPVDGLHGELEGEFRPALGKLADKITGMIQSDSPNWEAFWDAVSKALAREPKLLLAWSLKDKNGNAVQVTEANIQRTKQLLVHKLWMIVAGQRPSDPRPDGQQIPTVSPEADAKN